MLLLDTGPGDAGAADRPNAIAWQPSSARRASSGARASDARRTSIAVAALRQPAAPPAPEGTSVVSIGAHVPSGSRRLTGLEDSSVVRGPSALAQGRSYAPCRCDSSRLAPGSNPLTGAADARRPAPHATLPAP